MIKCPALDVYFFVWSFLGSSTFYSLALPLLLWNVQTRYVPLLAITYGLNCYVGNFLKSFLSTGELAPVGAGEMDRVGSAIAIRNARVHDNGWPSVTTINALSLPFFILRFVYGNNAWLWEMEDVAAQTIFVHYAIAFIWMGNVVMAKLYR